MIQAPIWAPLSYTIAILAVCVDFSIPSSSALPALPPSFVLFAFLCCFLAPSASTGNLPCPHLGARRLELRLVCVCVCCLVGGALEWLGFFFALLGSQE